MTVAYLCKQAGLIRFLGNNPAPIQGSYRVYGDGPEQPLLPRSQWEGFAALFGEDHPALSVIGVADQGGVGMCNAAATAKALEFARWEQGLGMVRLSAGDLYHRICGGRDEGSTLEDGLAEAGNGIATTQTCPYSRWQTSDLAAAAERADYKAEEFFLCPTFEHQFSAACMGFAVITGIPWYAEYNPDSELWLPPGRRSVGGHAIFGYAPAARTVRGKLQFGIRHLQSWGDSYGRHGRFVIPESAYESSIGGWWAVRQVTASGPGTVPAPAYSEG
jgi:hypothetical protein